jgi:hypothetical protein
MLHLFYFNISGAIGIEPGLNDKKKNPLNTEMLPPSSACKKKKKREM